MVAIPEGKLQRLKVGLDQASAVVLKYFLRYRDLAAGMNDTKEKVADRFLGYVQDGSIPVDEALAGLVALQEYSNKKVYLFHLPKATVRELDLDSLPKRISKAEGVRIAYEPDNPVVNYSFVDEKRIRVSFSETHQWVKLNLETLRASLTPITRVAVLQVERGTGFTTLSLDPPEQVNPHGSSQGYYHYYLHRAEQLLGGAPNRYSLGDALMKLEASNLVRIPHGRGHTNDGEVGLTSDFDTRDMGVYGKLAGSLVTKDSGRYIWLGGKDAEELGLASARILERNVPTDIHAGASFVRFTKDCLEEEVTYVLTQLRAHAE